MIAAVPQMFIDAGILAGSTTAVITLITVGTRSRLGQWVVRSIREDMATARRQEMIDVVREEVPRIVQPILAELRPNGGSSFRDQVNRFMVESAADRAGLHRKIDELGDRP